MTWHQAKAASSIALVELAKPLIREALKYKWETLIDFGCGYGLHCAEFAKSGRKITGIDLGFVPEALEDAKAGGYTLISGSWEKLGDKTFDVGYSACCLEHLPAPIAALHEWGRIVKPGGKLFIAVPAYSERLSVGHIVTGWHVGQLMYCLALAGWDCRNGRFTRHEYEIWGIADRPQTMVLGDQIRGDWGDNRDRLPPALTAENSHFRAALASWNW